MRELFVKEQYLSQALRTPKLLEVLCENDVTLVKVEKHDQETISKVLQDLISMRGLFISDKHNEEWFFNAVSLLARRYGIGVVK